MNYELNIAETYLHWHRLTVNKILSKPLLKLDDMINELTGIHYDDFDIFFTDDENSY